MKCYIELRSLQSSSGFYIQSDPVQDTRVSTGLFVFSESSKVLDEVAVGDQVSLSGKVEEFRPSDDPTFLTSTELDSPTDITVLSSGNSVTPLVLGTDRSPPTQNLSALDIGPDGFLSVPNNQSRADTVNAAVQPIDFAIDFWSSLEGQLVTVPKPISIGFENSFGEFWVRGDWEATSVNSRGGLTLSFGMFSAIYMCVLSACSDVPQAPMASLTAGPSLSSLVCLSITARTPL